MRKTKLFTVRRWFGMLVPGVAVLGTSCSHDVRKQIVAAGLDFVKAAAGDALGSAIPLNDIFPK